ncbi:hypothetical protein BDN70DRAFT_939531 [Pholiota conissans]|uniref:Uncharacterized protein n=1 Tax=Pholiota conissans TaxID=109636 RepID=A0A9P6CQY7_9AGAR|nr:hypothetical protein BDN70DRAFT_939531 [Pholiota conissans]
MSAPSLPPFLPLVHRVVDAYLMLFTIIATLEEGRNDVATSLPRLFTNGAANCHGQKMGETSEDGRRKAQAEEELVLVLVRAGGEESSCFQCKGELTRILITSPPHHHHLRLPYNKDVGASSPNGNDGSRGVGEKGRPGSGRPTSPISATHRPPTHLHPY